MILPSNPTLAGPPGKPKDITEEEATMDSLSISWSNSDNMGVVLGYQVTSSY